MVVVCVLLPRFELVVAARGRRELLAGPAALVGDVGGEQRLGEVSPAAEAHGVQPGMPLGEALVRCRALRVVTPDPLAVHEAWEAVLAALEGLGAAVEDARPGLAYFAARGLYGLYGGLDGVLFAVIHVVRPPARIGAGPSRFAAVAAATRARTGRPETVSGTTAAAARAYLATVPITLLRARPETTGTVALLERLGVRTLGDLAAWPRASAGARFGPAGFSPTTSPVGETRRRALVRRPNTSPNLWSCPIRRSGPQLEHVLALLVGRVLAHHDRRGRTARAGVLSAALVGGGTWRERVMFREALADPTRMRLALTLVAPGAAATSGAPALLCRATSASPSRTPSGDAPAADTGVRRGRCDHLLREPSRVAGKMDGSAAGRASPALEVVVDAGRRPRGLGGDVHRPCPGDRAASGSRRGRNDPRHRSGPSRSGWSASPTCATR